MRSEARNFAELKRPLFLKFLEDLVCLSFKSVIVLKVHGASIETRDLTVLPWPNTFLPEFHMY